MSTNRKLTKWSKQTFRKYTEHDIGYPRCEEPSVFNSIVSVRLYQVTFEELKEPNEVIHARLLKLWHESDNHHHYSPLAREASLFGIELPNGEFGKLHRARKGY